MKLEVNQTIKVNVKAKCKWNNTTLEIAEGERYEFTAIGKWVDFIIKSDADGYANFYMRLFDSKKRVKRFAWFALIGSLNKNEKKHYLIGKENVISFDENGVLYCFANDAKWFYWNNIGHVDLHIKRIQ